MNTRILLASFALVFLAELGDKTQLTALAFCSTSRSPWSVFFGTSLALVTSTAIAVVLGAFLSRHVPAKILHISSGVMFVLVGLLMLVNVARKAPAAEAPDETLGDQHAGEPHLGTGMLSDIILRQAIHFEEEVVLSLREYAAGLPEGEQQALCLRLADAHSRHAESLGGVGRSVEQAGRDAGALPAAAEAQAAEEELFSDGDGATEAMAALRASVDSGATGTEGERGMLDLVLRKQEAAAQFYLALARTTLLHDARDTFRWLAMEEIRHTQDLCTIVNHPDEVT
jgi:rubrerythrin